MLEWNILESYGEILIWFNLLKNFLFKEKIILDIFKYWIKRVNIKNIVIVIIEILLKVVILGDSIYF